MPEHPYKWFTTCFLGSVNRHLTRTVLCWRIREGLRKSLAEDRSFAYLSHDFSCRPAKDTSKIWAGLDQCEKGIRFCWSYVAERDVPDSQISSIDWKSGIHSGLSMKYTEIHIRPWQKRFKKLKVSYIPQVYRVKVESNRMRQTF